MKKLLLVIVTAAALSCSKNGKTCYECDNYIGPQASGYHDMGCFTDEEWNNIKITDYNGNILDKNTHCRKK